MKKNYIKLIATLLVLLFGSCKKFLDVQPEDKVLEDQLFTTQKGINTALNGLYVNLGKNDLYGDNLTLSTMDILAQRYNLSSTHALYKIATYAYTDAPATTKFSAIWTQAYANILNINAFLENLDKYPGVLDAKTEALYRGEVIAMRAFLHFDLLRIYGPRYSTADSTKQSIPYYESSQSKVNPLLPANQVMQKVLTDFARAEALLSADPIITAGVNAATSTGNADFTKSSRNLRLNYYAVKGLQARALLYRGDKVSALEAAKVVIQKADYFKWTTTANALTEKVNPDRIFSTEMIFGTMNTQLYTRYTALFDPAVNDQNILAPATTRLTAVFESNESDYRYNLNWQIPTTGIKAYKTFYKYADVVDKTKTFRFYIPILKISEMYYIAAECEPVAATGITQLNVVRFNRGLTNLAATVNVNTELQKEYQKDFFGEGQLFYYYKRRNVTSVGNGTGSGNITIVPVVPLPLEETQYR
ncbi:RagB/SusD family nutrient uptake outer membrane protein [Pedobacter sp. MW01-1-1]|uniref:RagB/SusD family nutrient uptake outer membrane protein n=1 Tax=Pedobacter sp. MW01-1-1 TaxID=3383027 RepID=UPI003FF080C0